jgi:hypothetical protein
MLTQWHMHWIMQQASFGRREFHQIGGFLSSIWVREHNWSDIGMPKTLMDVSDKWAFRIYQSTCIGQKDLEKDLATTTTTVVVSFVLQAHRYQE